MLAMVRRQNFDIAISAPVLPAETHTSASPFFTASIAFHIDDFQRPWRSAWLGLSSMRTATSQWTKSLTAASLGSRSSTGRTASSRPKIRNRTSGRRSMTFSRAGRITSGPWSPPMASMEIRITLAQVSQIPSGRRD